jgi:hypothetical protein
MSYFFWQIQHGEALGRIFESIEQRGVLHMEGFQDLPA